MKFDNHPIGLFDSGVGGLSILVETKKLLPQESFIFLADQAHNPYGAKTKKQLQNLGERITQFLIKQNIKLLVVACNTATCYALEYLRSKFAIPIVGTVPAVKPAVLQSKAGKIAIMSTPATAKSSYLSSLISSFAPATDVLRLGCRGLEEAIEYWRLETAKKLITKYTSQIKKFGADVVVLGCTHYPFLKSDIEDKLGKKIRVIDSSEAIAKRVKNLLKKTGFSKNKRSDNYYSTSDPETFSKVASILLKHKVIAQRVKI